VIIVHLDNIAAAEEIATGSYALVEPDIRETELRYVLDAVTSGWVSSLGPYVREFERRFAAYCGVGHGVSSCNGTAALHLALASLGIRRGDEVVVPSLTFVATAAAVAYTGATPVFAESERDSWCMDPKSLRKLITPRTRAIVAVHLYGHPADMDSILALAAEHRLPVIEDAAEAHGATYRGRKIGGLGKIAIFSFYGNKTITAGEGGILVTDDAALADRARLLANHAMDPERRYWHAEIGYNYRLSNIQAALALAQFERLEKLLERKREIFEWYGEALRGIGEVQLNPCMPWAENSYWLTCALLPRDVSSEAVMSNLRAAGIETRPFFTPMHLLPPFRNRPNRLRRLPIAEDLASRGINLPSSVKLSREDVRYIAAALIQSIRRAA
jgi:perosamine synthetase